MSKKQFALVMISAVVSGFVSGGISTWLPMPQSVLAQDLSQKVITAEEFRVVDTVGNARAKLSVGNDGDVLLALLDSRGNPRVSLSTLPDGTSLLAFSQEKSVVRAYIGMTPDPTVSLFGDTGEPGVSIRMMPEPQVVIFDDTGEIRAAMHRSTDGEPALILKGNGAILNLADAKENSRIALSLKNSKPALSLLDDQERFRVEIVEEGLSVIDESGRDRAVLGTTELKHTDTGSTETRAVSSLVLFDEEGKVVWSAP